MNKSFNIDHGTYFQFLDVVALKQLQLHHQDVYRTSFSTRPFYFRSIFLTEDLKKMYIKNDSVKWKIFALKQIVRKEIHLPISIESRMELVIFFKLFENWFHWSLFGITSSSHLKSGKPSFHSSYRWRKKKTIKSEAFKCYFHIKFYANNKIWLLLLCLKLHHRW